VTGLTSGSSDPLDTRHANEDLFRRLCDAYRGGDRDAAVRFFAPDAVIHYSGPGRLHGAHVGHEGILGFAAAQDRLLGGKFLPELLDLVASDRAVFIRVRITPADGAPTFQRVVVCVITDGLISEPRVFEVDPLAAGAFFSHGPAYDQED
jgi:ketosteroid isomerase-like protein